MTLGQTIRASRENKNWKQRHLAAALDCSESYISCLESDKIQNPTAETIIALANALDITPNDLLIRSHNQTVPPTAP